MVLSKQRRFLILSGLVLVYVFTMFLNSKPVFDDFRVYEEAGAKAINHKTVFDVENHYQFKYSPSVALFFGAIITPCPKEARPWIFYFLFTAAWIWLIFFALPKYFSFDGTISEFQGKIITSLVFIVSIRDELRLGQINGLPLILSLGTYVLLNAETRFSQVLAALCLALAILFKLHFLFIAPIFLIQRRWLGLLLIPVWLIIISYGVTALYSGWEFSTVENGAWLKSLTKSSEGLLGHRDNESLIGWLLHLGFSQRLAFIFWFMTAAAAGLLFLSIKRTQKLEGYAYGLGISGILTPIVWPYWAFLLIPVFFFMLSRLKFQKSSWPNLAVLVLFSLVTLIYNQDWCKAYVQVPINILFFIYFAYQIKAIPVNQAP